MSLTDVYFFWDFELESLFLLRWLSRSVRLPLQILVMLGVYISSIVGSAVGWVVLKISWSFSEYAFSVGGGFHTIPATEEADAIVD